MANMQLKHTTKLFQIWYLAQETTIPDASYMMIG